MTVRALAKPKYKDSATPSPIFGKKPSGKSFYHGPANETREVSNPEFGHNFGDVQVVSPSFKQSCPLALSGPTHCPFGGACHTCPSRVQTKLKIGHPGDKYEQEADRVAEQVMRTTVDRSQKSEVRNGNTIQEQEDQQIQTKPVVGRITPLVQRQVEEEEEVLQPKEVPGQTLGVTRDVQTNINNLRGTGKPLSESERSFFEPRFRADFSNVRVHNDTRADSAARSVNARAFTFRHNVVFGAGEYSSDTLSSRQLLAHELTHVVQQKKNDPQKNENNQGGKSLMPSDSSDDGALRLKRDPDVIHKGYYSFYLLAGGGKEVTVQFHYPGSGNDVTVKMTSLRKTAMVQDTYTLSDPSKFSPKIVYEDGVTTVFDLDGDNKGDIEVHVTMDAMYNVEFLTAESDPGDPKYERHEVKETFAVMKWTGVEKIIKVSVGEDQQAWVIRPHPHPHVNFMYYNTVTRAAFIPSKFTTSSKFRGVRSGKTAIKNEDVTVLDWGESWNGFNVAGGILTWGQIDAASVEGMVKSIESEVGPGSCIDTLTIIGHGSPGSISVGDGTGRIVGKHIRGGALDSTSDIYDPKMAGLLARLTPKFCKDGQAELRGCNVGDGLLGETFAQLLANLWRVDVKAHIGTIRGGGYWTTGKWTRGSPETKKP